jgi:hypothetical protein
MQVEKVFCSFAIRAQHLTNEIVGCNVKVIAKDEETEEACVIIRLADGLRHPVHPFR